MRNGRYSTVQFILKPREDEKRRGKGRRGRDSNSLLYLIGDCDVETSVVGAESLQLKGALDDVTCHAD